MAAVEMTGIEKSFGPSVALADFSVSIGSGELVCLLGPSGCGKTTVLNMLAGFEQPTGGSILIGDKRVRAPGPDRAVVFQGDDSLFAWLTALENVEFGLRMRGVPGRERRERARHYLDLVGLSGQEQKHPPQLSGGMKQRIQIARVLANEPVMLLMDEPFAALDAQTRLLMQEQMRAIANRAKTSVFFITHDIDEAIMLGNRIGVMKAGPASTLKGHIAVDLGEERQRTDAAFMSVYREAYEMIREEVLKSARGTSGGAKAAR